MKTLFTIVAREYVQRVRTRTFVFTTVAAPFLVLGLAGISGYLAAGAAIPERDVALVDHTGRLADGLVPRLEAVGLRARAVPPGDGVEAELAERLRRGELMGVLVLDERTLIEGEAVWRGVDDLSALRAATVRHSVTQTALEARLREVDPEGSLDPLIGGGRLILDVPGRTETPGGGGVGVALAGAFFLYFVLLVYGTRVLRAVQEEKTVRIVEVIISTVRPAELMLGKILGVGGVGLTQLLVWMGSGALLAGVVLPLALPALTDAADPAWISDAVIPDGPVLAFFAICFLAGYFIYASLFAAVGAICSTEEEAQQLQIPVVLLVLVPFLFLIPVVDDPDSTLAVSMSLVPFFSPVLMFARVAVSEVPVWQSALSVVLMLGALLVTAWVAGRIYRTGILMQGKRATLPEIWRWVREG